VRGRLEVYVSDHAHYAAPLFWSKDSIHGLINSTVLCLFINILYMAKTAPLCSVPPPPPHINRASQIIREICGRHGCDAAGSLPWIDTEKVVLITGPLHWLRSGSR
jgi:hypothetical protein